MADEYITGVNWWEPSRNRFEATTPSSTSSAGSFGWLTDMAATAVDMKSRSSSSSMDHSLRNSSAKRNLRDEETNLQMMNLGMASQTVDWNQPLLQEEVGMLSSQVQWRPASLMMQGMFGSENLQNQPSGFDNSSINGYHNSYQASYDEQLLRAPRRKPPPEANSGHLQFSNNAPFWTASTAASPAMIDVRPSFFSPIQPQFSSPSLEEKPNKNLVGVISTKSSTAVARKSGSQATNKRARNEAQAPLPAFKVRKEKVGDRITTLQQLVSPFGKTDTASVLTETIDYIKILHEKVYELSIPYMKNGVVMPLQQNNDKSKLNHEVPKQDLRSRGLCLMSLSSTYSICTPHETNFDFWNPTFGGTFR